MILITTAFITRQTKQISALSEQSSKLALFYFLASSLITHTTYIMSPLFSLSRELRAQIIEHVLNATASPPEFPPKSDAIIYSDIKYRAWVGHRHAYYSQRPSSLTPNCLPLLLVNRQLSNETRALITSRAPDYALDIAIEDECFVYLTWLSVPFLSGHISTLTVTV